MALLQQGVELVPVQKQSPFVTQLFFVGWFYLLKKARLLVCRTSVASLGYFLSSSAPPKPGGRLKVLSPKRFSNASTYRQGMMKRGGDEAQRSADEGNRPSRAEAQRKVNGSGWLEKGATYLNGLVANDLLRGNPGCSVVHVFQKLDNSALLR